MTTATDGVVAIALNGAGVEDSRSLLERIRLVEDEIDGIYEVASFGSYCLGADGTYASINTLELSWLGCSREALIGKRRPIEFLSPESEAKLIRHLHLHGRYGFSELELELVGLSGSPRLISMSFNGSCAEDGSPHKGRTVSFDMTATQLIRNMQRIAAISFESLCGMCVTDTAGTILRVNAGFTELCGYSNHEAVGQNMRFLNSGIQVPHFYDAMWKTINATGHWQGEIRNRRKDGQTITEWLSIAAVKNANGAVTNYVGTFYDITAAKVSQEEVTRMAFHDALTQLPNRRLLQQRIEHAMQMEGRNSLRSALLFLDLDHFKAINDARGHEAGDFLLIEVGRRIRSVLRDGDTVARIGGDEFAVLLEGMGSAVADPAAQARQIGEKLLATVARPYWINEMEFRCTASLGISMLNTGETASSLLTHADLAMYQAKKEGRNSLRFFDPVMQIAASSHAELAQDLQRAIAQMEFELHYQPQVDVHAKLIGAEALLRWRHPKRGWVAPAEIIPLAEETGIIVPIGKWVLETACRQMQRWQQHTLTCQLTMAVNVSARQFARDDFVEVVLTVLHETGVDPTLLHLEVTESMMLDAESAIKKMTLLRVRGVKFSIDDFGTGYSSLSILTRLPIANLKIDKSFVDSMTLSTADQVIVQTIIGMAHSLGMVVIAEGVETVAQHEALMSYGCEQFQGYLFGKALSEREFTALVEG